MASYQQDNASSTRKRTSQVSVVRPIYTEHDFQKGYEYLDDEETNLEKLKKKVDEIEVTPRTFWRFICSVLPILKWLPNYKLKEDIIGDTISGITTAIMRVPQGTYVGPSLFCFSL